LDHIATLGEHDASRTPVDTVIAAVHDKAPQASPNMRAFVDKVQLATARQVEHDLFVVNNPSDVTHVAVVGPKQGGYASDFFTRCGWAFAKSDYRLIAEPTTKQCKKCFREVASSSDESAAGEA